MRVGATAWRFFAASRPLQLLLLAVFVIGWVVHAIDANDHPTLGGLFRWIGIDFGFFYAHGQVFASGDLANVYSVGAAAPYREALAAYSNVQGVAMPSGPVPYPPIYGWLVGLLTAAPAPQAFAIWTGINAIAGVALAWRAASFFPADRRLLVGGLALIPTAVVFSLWFGQPQLFLAVAFGEAFVAFRKGRDLTAGVLLAVLLFKPQYLLLILLILLWKGRWNAIAGFIAGGLVILAASVLVAGPATFVAYIGTLIESATASGGALFTAVAPEVMVNWRALVLGVPLGIPSVVQVAITLILTAVTVVAVLIAWRAPWLPNGPRFAGQMTLLSVATVLTAWHSHIHGASMIVVPLAAFLASGLGRDLVERLIGLGIRALVGAAIVSPWLWFAVLNRSHTEANRMVTLALVAGFLLLFVLLVRREERASVPAPASVSGQAEPA